MSSNQSNQSNALTHLGETVSQTPPGETVVVETSFGETVSQEKIDFAVPPKPKSPAGTKMSAPNTSKPEMNEMIVAKPPSPAQSVIEEETGKCDGYDLPLIMNPWAKAGWLQPGVWLEFHPHRFIPNLEDFYSPEDRDFNSKVRVVAYEGKLMLQEMKEDGVMGRRFLTVEDYVSEWHDWAGDWLDGYINWEMSEDEGYSLDTTLYNEMRETGKSWVLGFKRTEVGWVSEQDPAYDEEAYSETLARVEESKSKPKPKVKPTPKEKADAKAKATPRRRIGTERFVLGAKANFKETRFTSKRKAHHAIRILEIVRDADGSISKEEILEVIEEEAEDYCGGSTQPWKSLASLWIRDLLKMEEIVVDDEDE